MESFENFPCFAGLLILKAIYNMNIRWIKEKKPHFRKFDNESIVLQPFQEVIKKDMLRLIVCACFSRQRSFWDA